MKSSGKFADWGPFVLRLAVGAVFIASGSQKLFGAFGGPGLRGFSGWLNGLGIRPPMAWAVVVALVEFVGGIFLVLGILTRPAALLIGIVMVVALVTVHVPRGFFDSRLAMVLLAACISLLFTGSGNAALRD